LAQGVDAALWFNDQAVSENYSIKAGLDLLKKRELNFLHGWRKSDRKMFRHTVIHIILSTDMSR
jgi:hypothetical protein